MSAPELVHFFLFDDGIFPNNQHLPVIALLQAIPADAPLEPSRFETLFTTNGWPAAWRNGLYDFHHYHATAHEVLGIYAGWVKAQLGGPGGTTLTLRAGDVLILPAGVSHKNVSQSNGFSVVGAYPLGQRPDMQYGKPGERPASDHLIRAIPLPTCDPVFGADGPLYDLWLTPP